MKDVKHYKCLTDLKEIIQGVENRRLRPIPRGDHPTLYKDRAEGKYRTVMGVRVCDYKFSTDEKWVLPDDQMGLSFSSSWTNLKFVHKMMSRKKKPVDVFWVFSEADIPPGMKFQPDQEKEGHHFLTVTKKMRIEELIYNLKWVADRLSIIKEGGSVL